MSGVDKKTEALTQTDVYARAVGIVVFVEQGA